MSLKFSKPKTTTVNNISGQTDSNQIIVPQEEEVQEFNIVEKRNEIETELLNSPEIEALTADIYLFRGAPRWIFYRRSRCPAHR